jgi:hypothetical protein
MGLVRKEVLYNILIVFRIPKKLVRLIRVCFHVVYSRVDAFSVYSDLNKAMLCLHYFLILL